MENYKYLLDKLNKDLENNDIFKQDYLRVKRSKKYHRKVLEKFGAIFLPIESYKKDHEIIKYSERNQYELMKVKDILIEIDKTLQFFKI